jgi:lysophospholipase L1-like esterase
MKQRCQLSIVVVVSLLVHANGIYSQIRIMPLGNSITQGVAGSSDDTGYRRALYLSLTAAGHTINFVGSQTTGIPTDFDRNHEGHSGWRADQIRDNVSTWLTTNPADIILLHIGTNDISQGNTNVSTVSEVNEILNRIDARSTATVVFLARIINRADGYSAATTDYNARLQALADTRIASGDLIIVVDQEAALTYPADLADAVHPNDAGYLKMAHCWFTTLSEYLHPVPTVTSIVPAAKAVGDALFSLTVNGTNFMNGVSTVNLNSSPRATSFVNSTQLTATVLAVDLLTAGSRSITVVNAPPGGGTSSVQTLTVDKATTTTALNGSPNPSNSGQSVLFTAIVTPSVATGSVAFFGGAVSLGTGLITAGSATLSTMAIPPGVHMIRATYGGDDNYLTSEITVSQTVNPVIAASAGGNGSIDPSGSVPVTLDGNQTFNIVPNEGYHIVDVLVDGLSQGAISSYTFTGVVGNHTIEASFASNAYAITVSTGANGSIVPIGPTVLVNHGDSQQFMMTPVAGYHVATLTIDGVRVNPASTHTFSGVTSSHTITATFALDSYAITGPADYNLDIDGNSATDMKLAIMAKPAEDATISAIAYVTPPASAPTLPPNALPLYLDVTSSLPDYAFVSTVRLDLDGIAGFGPASVFACYNQVTSTWVPVEGAYLAADPLFASHPSFTFPAVHFGAFAFFIPAETPTHLYVSTSATVATPGTIYPNDSWRPPGPQYGGTDDWSWSGSQVASVYLVPEAGSHFGSADITLEWDVAMTAFLAVDFGAAGSPNGLYGSGHAYSSTTSVTAPYGSGRIRIECTRQDNGNFSTVVGDYIARVDFALLRPGHSPIAVIGATFAVLENGNPPTTTFMVPMQAEVKTYLGDVAKLGDLTSGDGKVDFEDLVAWSYSYWSGVPGYEPGMQHYKIKYDIGPTQNGLLSSLPVVDGKIDFEDLVIFSMAYGEYNAFHLPKAAVTENQGMTIATGTPFVSNGETRVPIMISGDVRDVRAMSIVASGNFGRFIGAEKGALLRGYTTPVIVMSKGSNGSVNVDLAVAGLQAAALAREGEVVVLHFAGTASVGVTRAEARSSANAPLAIDMRTPESETPMAFGLEQNYPNPFNPSTTIRYALPNRSFVSLCVFSCLGERVVELVNGEVGAGYHIVRLDAAKLASGVYFYRLQAGGFVQTRTLLLLK